MDVPDNSETLDSHHAQAPYYQHASERIENLQKVAKIWGKYGTELCAEVGCTWINVTTAPFLMDSILDTANLIEAAQRTLQEQLNK
ncbi:hypothetical protein, conserved [Eimeria necatrix]|uniref:Uncharacterized protein n=1 Tax=Eimeria necatrix TaxID=51315 RepID=U6MQM5_9EIME|nr:hypothetical protein, conserved [Eimeria necatrix]CDJ63960.1 hypothetical protein, conserved [Eimeria necatrix]